MRSSDTTESDGGRVDQVADGDFRLADTAADRRLHLV
jgi:hypothetical protein